VHCSFLIDKKIKGRNESGRSVFGIPEHNYMAIISGAKLLFRGAHDWSVSH
jgi:hypothetical protein